MLLKVNLHALDCAAHCNSVLELTSIIIVTGLLIRAVEMLCAVALTYNNYFGFIDVGQLTKLCECPPAATDSPSSPQQQQEVRDSY